MSGSRVVVFCGAPFSSLSSALGGSHRVAAYCFPVSGNDPMIGAPMAT